MQRRRYSSVHVILAALPFLVLGRAHAQRNVEARAEGRFNNVPPAVMMQAEALGSRVLRSGKERTVFTGNLLNDRGENAKLKVTLQLPGAVAIEGVRPSGSIVFDGNVSLRSVSKKEEDLFELFSSDTAEGFLSSVQDERAVRLLGRRVREATDGQANPDNSFYDIYEAVVPVLSSPASPERLKRYLFDSQSGLLSRTEYLDESYSPPLRIEVRFSDWRRIDGSAYPGRIDRMEDGRLVLSWSAAKIQALPRVDPSRFGIATEIERQEGQ